MIIPDELLNKINPIKKNIAKGIAIFNEGDTCSYLAIINKGVIKAYKSFSDGHEKIIRILNENDIIGINLIFSEDPSYKASFIALEDSTITLIAKNDLIYLMQTNANILNDVLKLISNSAIELNEHIKLLSYKTIREKILSYLYQEYLKNKKTTFKISLSKTEFSAYLNVERPSLSTEISKLIHDGIIENNDKEYKILNLKAIEALL